MHKNFPTDIEANRAYCFVSTPDDAIKLAREVLVESVSLFEEHTVNGVHGLDGLVWNIKRNYREAGGRQKVLQFLSDLSTNANPVIRFHVEQAFVQYYADQNNSVNPTEGLQHVERCIAIYKAEIAPKYRDTGMFLTIVNSRFDDDERKNLEIRARLLKDLAEFGLRERFFPNAVYEWANVTKHAAEALELQGEFKGAATLLQRAIKALPTSDERTRLEESLRLLARQEPSLRAESTDIPLSVDRLLSSDKVLPSGSFLRFVVGQGELCIVFAAASDRYGLLRVDATTFQLRSTQIITNQMSFTPRLANLSHEHVLYGPSVAKVGQTIFVGHPEQGIIAFRPDGTNQLFNEANGLISQQIWALDSLDRRLYSVVGDPWNNSGVMEIDPETGSSELLFSTFQREPKSRLDRHAVLAIAADEQRGGLWVLSGSQNWHQQGAALFFFNTNTRQEEQVFEQIAWDSRYFDLRMSGGRLLISDPLMGLSFDTKSRALSLLYSDGKAVPQCKPELKPNWIRQRRNLQLRRLTSLRGNLFAVDEGELLLFEHGKSTPRHLLNDVSTLQDERVRDIGLHREGVLILSNKAIYLIRDKSVRGATKLER